MKAKHIIPFLTVLAVIFALVPHFGSAQGLFPGETDAARSDFRLYIRNFYFFSIGAGMLVATVLIMIGGMIWVTSAGNQGRIGKAKEYIVNAIIGVILLLGAFTILQLINPNFVNLAPFEFPDLTVTLRPCLHNLDENRFRCSMATENSCTNTLHGEFRADAALCADLCVVINRDGTCSRTSSLASRLLSQSNQQIGACTFTRPTREYSECLDGVLEFDCSRYLHSSFSLGLTCNGSQLDYSGGGACFFPDRGLAPLNINGIACIWTLSENACRADGRVVQRFVPGGQCYCPRVPIDLSAVDFTTVNLRQAQRDRNRVPYDEICQSTCLSIGSCRSGRLNRVSNDGPNFRCKCAS